MELVYKILPVRLLVILAMSMAAQTLFAQNDNDQPEVIRPVLASYTIEGGGSSINDTYLSPIKYKGWTLGLRYERMQAMKFDPEKWVMKLAAAVDLDRTTNLVGNATMWYGGVYFDWGMLQRNFLSPSISIGYGGSASFSGGCLYSQRNGNNPASAKVALTLNLTGFAAWSGKLGKLPLTAMYQPTLPVTGAFFSPDYGELYYEIYLGDHSGLVHPAWWGNYFNLINRLTVDFHIGATSLRVGYSCNILSTKVNHITTRMIRQEAILGISGEWISFNPSKKINKNTKTIRSLWK